LAIVVISRLDPYIKVDDNDLALAAQWAIFCIAFVSLLIKLDLAASLNGLNSFDVHALSVILVLVFFAVPAMALYQVSIVRPPKRPRNALPTNAHTQVLRSATKEPKVKRRLVDFGSTVTKQLGHVSQSFRGLRLSKRSVEDDVPGARLQDEEENAERQSFEQAASPLFLAERRNLQRAFGACLARSLSASLCECVQLPRQQRPRRRLPLPPRRVARRPSSRLPVPLQTFLSRYSSRTLAAPRL
jgi:hypothetical protein